MPRSSCAPGSTGSSATPRSTTSATARRRPSSWPRRWPAASAAAEELERREEIDRADGRLRSLPEPQRAAIVMREMEGLSHEEIAAALGVSGGAARQAIYRARRALRDGAGMLVPLPLLQALLAAGSMGTADGRRGSGRSRRSRRGAEGRNRIGVGGRARSARASAIHDGRQAAGHQQRPAAGRSARSGRAGVALRVPAAGGRRRATTDSGARAGRSAASRQAVSPATIVATGRTSRAMDRGGHASEGRKATTAAAAPGAGVDQRGRRGVRRPAMAAAAGRAAADGEDSHSGEHWQRRIIGSGAVASGHGSSGSGSGHGREAAPVTARRLRLRRPLGGRRSRRWTSSLRRQRHIGGIEWQSRTPAKSGHRPGPAAARVSGDSTAVRAPGSGSRRSPDWALDPATISATTKPGRSYSVIFAAASGCAGEVCRFTDQGGTR